MPTGVYPRGPVSDETRRKISLANTGRKHTEETRRHMSESHKGYKFPEHGLAKAIEVNTGRPCSPETKKKIREHHKVYFNQESIRREISERQRGEKGNNWKGGVTPANKIVRTSIEYKLWREAVFTRDNWTCQDCGKRGSTVLHPHHLKSFANFPELRFAIDNGVTLCVNCHMERHAALRLEGKRYA